MKTDRLFSYYKDYLVLLFLVIISMSLVLSNQNKQVTYFKLWLAGVMGSFQEGISAIGDYFYLAKKNEILLLQNTRLALENEAMRELRLENARLRELIGFREKSKLNLVAAKVIGKKKRGFINDIMLNVGTIDSVSKNMPIVVSDGLVGKLHQVGKNKSFAQLLLDQNFRVSIITQRSRVKGIIAWKGGSYCVMNEVPKRSDVKVGDLIVTSGFGEIFPEGLQVGTVESTSESPRELFMKIKIKPAVDFKTLEEVFIVRQQ